MAVGLSLEVGAGIGLESMKYVVTFGLLIDVRTKETPWPRVSDAGTLSREREQFDSAEAKPDRDTRLNHLGDDAAAGDSAVRNG